MSSDTSERFGRGLAKTKAAASDPSRYEQRMTDLHREVAELARARPELRRLYAFLMKLDLAAGDDFYPGLTRRPFWSRDTYAWVPRIESAASEIRRELLALRGEQAFTVYDEPALDGRAHYVGQWNTYNFFHVGARFEEHCARCPRTMAALEQVRGFFGRSIGVAKFSALTPGAHIEAHYGAGNYKLRCHLTLATNAECAIRVGGETRSWVDGECLIFDDSLQHEVCNRGDTTRFVLLFDVWHPELDEVEIDVIERLWKIGAEHFPLTGEWKRVQSSLQRTGPDESWWVTSAAS